MTVVAWCVRKSSREQDLDAHGRGALAHADQHDAAAEHVDVTTLERCRLVVRVVAAVVHGERSGTEHRMEAVHHATVQRLPLPGRLRHRVDRDPAVDPGGVVALEQRVRERRQHEVVEAECLPAEAARPERRQV